MRTLDLVPSLRAEFLAMCGYGAGRTCAYDSFMEATYPSSRLPDSRPDGLISCQRGKSEWAAFIEAKANDSKIRPEQIQEYAHLASLLDADAVISISNEYARVPTELPFHIPTNKQRKRSFYHFAWAELRALVERYSVHPELSEIERGVLVDVSAFLWEKTSGITTFDQMPMEWPDFVRSSGVGVGFSAKTPGITEIVKAWHQERRDLRNKLAHAIGTDVELRHEIGVRAEFADILLADRKRLADEYELSARFFFRSCGITMDLLAELQDRKTTLTVDVPVPEGKGARALVTWIDKQTAEFEPAKTMVIFDWKGRNNQRAMPLANLSTSPEELYGEFRDAPKSIRIVRQVHDVKRFTSRKLFIQDLESLSQGMCDDLRGAGMLA